MSTSGLWADSGLQKAEGIAKRARRVKYSTECMMTAASMRRLKFKREDDAASRAVPPRETPGVVPDTTRSTARKRAKVVDFVSTHARKIVSVKVMAMRQYWTQSGRGYVRMDLPSTPRL